MITPMPDESEDLGRNKFIYKLLAIQSFFGITYFGNCVKTSNKSWKKYLLIVYDFLTFASFILFQYLTFSDKTYLRLFETSSNKVVMNFIFKVSAFAAFVEFFVVKIVSLINGSKIISTVNSFGNQLKHKLFVQI